MTNQNPIRIRISEVNAIMLSQDDNVIIRDEEGHRLSYMNQWYWYDESEKRYVACYSPRAYGGGSYYDPPTDFFLCQE